MIHPPSSRPLELLFGLSPLPSSAKWRFGSGLPSLKIERHPGGCILQRGTTQAIIIIIISKIPHIISEGSWNLTSFRSFSVLNPDILLVFWWKCSSDYSLECNLNVTVRAPRNSPWRGFARWLCGVHPSTQETVQSSVKNPSVNWFWCAFRIQ